MLPFRIGPASWDQTSPSSLVPYPLGSFAKCACSEGTTPGAGWSSMAIPSLVRRPGRGAGGLSDRNPSANAWEC